MGGFCESTCPPAKKFRNGLRTVRVRCKVGVEFTRLMSSLAESNQRHPSNMRRFSIVSRRAWGLDRELGVLKVSVTREKAYLMNGNGNGPLITTWILASSCGHGVPTVSGWRSSSRFVVALYSARLLARAKLNFVSSSKLMRTQSLSSLAHTLQSGCGHLLCWMPPLVLKPVRAFRHHECGASFWTHLVSLFFFFFLL